MASNKRRELNLELATGVANQYLAGLDLPNKDLVGRASLEYSLVNKAVPGEIQGGRVDYIVTKKKGVDPVLSASPEYGVINDGVPTAVGAVAIVVVGGNLQIQGTNSVAGSITVLGSAALTTQSTDLA